MGFQIRTALLPTKQNPGSRRPTVARLQSGGDRVRGPNDPAEQAWPESEINGPDVLSALHLALTVTAKSINCKAVPACPLVEADPIPHLKIRICLQYSSGIDHSLSLLV